MFQGTDLVSAPLVVSTDREEVIDFASSYFVEYTAVVNISSFSIFLYFSITDTKEGSQSVAIYISHLPPHFDFGNSKTLYHHNISIILCELNLPKHSPGVMIIGCQVKLMGEGIQYSPDNLTLVNSHASLNSHACSGHNSLPLIKT